MLRAKTSNISILYIGFLLLIFRDEVIKSFNFFSNEGFFLFISEFFLKTLTYFDYAVIRKNGVKMTYMFNIEL